MYLCLSNWTLKCVNSLDSFRWIRSTDFAWDLRECTHLTLEECAMSSSVLSIQIYDTLFKNTNMPLRVHILHGAITIIVCELWTLFFFSFSDEPRATTHTYTQFSIECRSAFAKSISICFDNVCQIKSENFRAIQTMVTTRIAHLPFDMMLSMY